MYLSETTQIIIGSCLFVGFIFAGYLDMRRDWKNREQEAIKARAEEAYQLWKKERGL